LFYIADYDKILKSIDNNGNDRENSVTKGFREGLPPAESTPPYERLVRP
jgi:hypothetical protein